MNKQIAAVTLLIGIAAVITTAYEYNDPIFNQILANELEELEASLDEPVQHSRNRRDEEAVHPDKCRPPFGKKRLCCAEESFHELHDKEKDLKRDCFRQVVGKDKDRKGERGDFDPFRCDKMEKHRKEMICIIQCIGQRKDILDGDGNADEAKFEDLIKESTAKESWFASIQDKVIQTCLAEAKNATANRDTSDTESCNPAGAKLMHCVFREIQLNCPAEQIKDQKACTRFREKLKRHSEFVPPPPPFLHDD